MHLSSRVIGIPDSITMKLNEKALNLTEEGKVIYNLSGGQLPIKPMPEFVEKIHHQLNFLKSYQYCPSAGFPALRKKLMKHFYEQRELPSEIFETSWDCIQNIRFIIHSAPSLIRVMKLYSSLHSGFLIRR
jgi:aspartate/methionine/tyrosine aminotransferase